jgi:hypothetical protein
MMLGVPWLASGQGGAGGVGGAGGGGAAGGAGGARGKERPLFFNLSHEEGFAGKTYFLTGGGRRYALTKVADQPQVLSRARGTNAFLRAVPDSQITHHVENAVFATDSVTLLYVSSDIDPQAGTWSMSSVQLYIPPRGATFAYAQARQSTPNGPLPLSAKRKLYGIAPAQTEQDLREERDLLDTVSHAATMVGCHPDLMSLEPNSAHTVHSNHVDRSIDVFLLGGKGRRCRSRPWASRTRADGARSCRCWTTPTRRSRTGTGSTRAGFNISRACTRICARLPDRR